MSEVFRDMPRVEMLGGARVVPRLVGASDSIPDVSAAVNDMDRPPRLSRWGLRPLLAVLALVAGLAACGTSEPPSIVLVVIDTVRADHLTPYGYERDTSPHIERLARSGTLFLQGVAASPWTGPSVASIVTGRYPDEVGIRGLRHRLPPSVPSLAQILRDAGYATAAVVSNALAGPAYGYHRGYDSFHFEHYKLQPEGSAAPPGQPYFTADRVTERALAWIASAPKPFFLYLHYTDPHEPYLPPPRWRDRFVREASGFDETLLNGKRFTRVPLDGDELAAVRAHYEAEIAFVDHEVGRLVDALGNDVIVVLTGDHGEEFRDHGAFLHGHTLYQELLRVPLLLAGPGIPRDRTSAVPASHVDILPTVLELARVPSPPSVNGRSLLGAPGEDRAAGEERVLFSILEGGKTRCVAARRGEWKLSSCGAGHDAVLHDLSRDPGESRDRASERRAVAQELARAIDERNARVVPGTRPVDPTAARRMEAALRALGYVE
jgi:arylsulfatase